MPRRPAGGVALPFPCRFPWSRPLPVWAPALQRADKAAKKKWPPVEPGHKFIINCPADLVVSGAPQGERGQIARACAAARSAASSRISARQSRLARRTTPPCTCAVATSCTCSARAPRLLLLPHSCRSQSSQRRAPPWAARQVPQRGWAWPLSRGARSARRGCASTRRRKPTTHHHRAPGVFFVGLWRRLPLPPACFLGQKKRLRPHPGWRIYLLTWTWCRHPIKRGALGNPQEPAWWGSLSWACGAVSATSVRSRALVLCLVKEKTPSRNSRFGRMQVWLVPPR